MNNCVKLLYKILNNSFVVLHFYFLCFVYLNRVRKNAIIRFSRLNCEDDPERYYCQLMRLFLPHRTELLKPATYDTYEAFFKQGTHRLSDGSVVLVQQLVTQKRNLFAHVQEELLQDAFQTAVNQDHDEPWNIAQPDQQKQGVDHVVTSMAESFPDLDGHKQKRSSTNPATTSTEWVPYVGGPQLSADEATTVICSLNDDQRQLFNHVITWCYRKQSGQEQTPLRIFITGGAGEYFGTKFLLGIYCSGHISARSVPFSKWAIKGGVV
jgi:hypothetical protein